ncbi:hypothetical protein [Brumimicrobium mesophilum]|uniref:hypothetical protein n=1 Tax=Brumimicrobium mesophilum TaxID=392717 RepID=UPI00131BA6D7|nr:hypothetical protein [Brumimicrobium mesophilum]
MRYLLYFVVTLLLVSSCNKEKRFSKKLMKGDNWTITNLTVDDESYGYYGNWLVEQDVNIYDSIPKIQWTSNGENATFQWQFQDKGKTFEIVYKDPTCVNCTTPPEDLDFQCYFLSGKYEVIKHKKDLMEFNSLNTIGFKGKEVKIKIERNN